MPSRSLPVSFIFLLFSIVIFSGCRDKSSNEKKKFSILSMANDGREYINQVDQLDSGAIKPIDTGVTLFSKPIWFDLIVKDNFYFQFNRKSGHFVKYTIENQKFTPVDSVELEGFNFLDNFNWINDNELLLISYNQKINKLNYAKIQAQTMKAEKGILPLSLPRNGFNSMSVGFSLFRDNLLYLGYTYHILKPNDFTSSDTLHVTTLDYSTLTPIHTSIDTRSTYPGSLNTEQPNTFSDEKKDFYFMASPGVALGNKPEKPTAIFRIKNGQNDIDSSFFFNVSTSPIQNHAYGMWYIGNGKAIIRSERKGLFKGMSDHYKVYQFDFFLFDISTKTVTRLDLPLDKGTSRSCVLVENGKVYISVNGKNDNFIWLLNPKSGEVKRALHLAGNLDYILRMERLN